MKMYFWDEKADSKFRGDNLRIVLPVANLIDKNNVTHYFFNQQMFDNPNYTIPNNSKDLFRKFLEGGSREYPSDGYVPIDIAAYEASYLMNEIVRIANTKLERFQQEAASIIKDRKPEELFRGTIRLYLSDLTTRDWRRKRSTDDIDMWIPNFSLFEYILKNNGWYENKETGEWEKKVAWDDKWTGISKSSALIASNDLFQATDFGSGEYLEGNRIKDIIKKKLKRGLDVDLSDIINVALENNIPEDENENSPWRAIVECCNMRDSRVTSNIISLCRYSYGIAHYLKRVGVAIHLHKDTFQDDALFSDEEVMRICKVSSHWMKTYTEEPTDVRKRIIGNLNKHEYQKLQQSRNLFNFMYKIIELLNTKYEKAKILIEIGNF